MAELHYQSVLVIYVPEKVTVYFYPTLLYQASKCPKPNKTRHNFFLYDSSLVLCLLIQYQQQN